MNFNFVETYVFTKLEISLDIYFSFASLVDFLALKLVFENFDQKFHWLSVQNFGTR